MRQKSTQLLLAVVFMLGIALVPSSVQAATKTEAFEGEYRPSTARAYVLAYAGSVWKCNPNQWDSDHKFYIYGTPSNARDKDWKIYAANAAVMELMRNDTVYGYFPDSGTPYICVGSTTVNKAGSPSLFTSTAATWYR